MLCKYINTCILIEMWSCHLSKTGNITFRIKAALVHVFKLISGQHSIVCTLLTILAIISILVNEMKLIT